MKHGFGSRLVLAAKALLMGAALALGGAAWSEAITMASTTSTEQSGLFGYLLPEYKKATGVDIKVVAVGTGQAIDIARRGDADVLFVHDKVAEEKFVAEGGATKRYPVMYNDFVLIGPKRDPVGVHGSDVVAALKKIAAANGPFVSRADKSGTNAAELRYWKDAGVANKGSGYKECGCGMGPALNIASAANAYTLSDRGTWLNFKNRGELAIVVEGDKRMFNQYGVMVVNPVKFPHVKAKLAQQFVDWITSRPGQAVIANYKIDGQQLFFPNADSH